MSGKSKGKGAAAKKPPHQQQKAAAGATAATPGPTSPASPDKVLSQQHHPAILPLIQDIEQQRGSRVLTYFLREGAAIADDALVNMYEQLLKIGKQPQIDLFLVSRGGATEVPWRIVSLIREFADRFCVLLPFHAASAATHISLGADEIVMTELAQLGPVDPSRAHPLLPEDPFAPAGQKRPLHISVQDLRHFMKFIEKEGDELETGKPEDATDIYTELMRQVHPLVIGAMEQSYALAKLLTKKLLALHMDPATDGDKIDALANALADDFKSHVYPINRREARELGLKVTDADESLRASLWSLWTAYTESQIRLSMQLDVPGRGSVPGTGMPIGFIDSTAGTSVAVVWFDSKGAQIGSGWAQWFI